MPAGSTKLPMTSCPTSTASVPIAPAIHAPELPAAEIEAATDYAKAEKAAATHRAYKSDFAIFDAWCAERQTSALPAIPEAVYAFLAFQADCGIKPSTLSRRVAAIRHAHKLAGLEPPTDDERVRAVMRGIRRRLGTAPRKKTPATSERIVAMAPVANERLTQVRDRALLLLGFASAMRRSELVALDIEDIEFVSEGLRVTIRNSKTDPEGHGAVIAIPHGSIACPVAALVAWIKAAAITAGPIFRPITKGQRIQETRLTDRSVCNVIKAYAARAGLDPANFAGHSAGLGPLVIPDVHSQTPKLNAALEEEWAKLAEEIVQRSVKRRIAAIAKHFGMDWPQNEEDWVKLVFEICQRAAIPAFMPPGRRRGAPEKWDYRKNRQLLADVMSLKAKGLNEHAACSHIAKNQKRFHHRYNVGAKTLYRQFLRAKKEFDEHEGLVLAPEDIASYLKHYIAGAEGDAEHD